MKLNANEQLFVNYNFVKGAQEFLKEAGLVKYASDEMEDLDANAVAQAMSDEGMEAPAEEAMEDNAVLEVANTLVELAQDQEEPAKSQIEEAAADVAEAVAPAGEAASEAEMKEEKKEEEGSYEAEKEAARKLARDIKSAADDAVTSPSPGQVLTHSGTDYDKGMGQTSLKTEKGEVGAEENVESQNVQAQGEDADVKQTQEGKDIFAKDYDKGMGQTTLKTEKGEVGAEENVEHKVVEPVAKNASQREAENKLATLAMQSNLAKLLGK